MAAGLTATDTQRDTAPVLGVTNFTLGQSQTAGRGIILAVTVAGTVTVTFADGTTFVGPFPVGVFDLKWAVTTVTLGSATATAASYL